MRDVIGAVALVLSACAGGAEVRCFVGSDGVQYAGCFVGSERLPVTESTAHCGDPATEWDCSVMPCFPTIQIEGVSCDGGVPSCRREGPEGVPGATEWRPFCLEAAP